MKKRSKKGEKAAQKAFDKMQKDNKKLLDAEWERFQNAVLDLGFAPVARLQMDKINSCFAFISLEELTYDSWVARKEKIAEDALGKTQEGDSEEPNQQNDAEEPPVAEEAPAEEEKTDV